MILSVWVLANALIVVGHSRWGAALQAPWLGFVDTPSLVVWASLAAGALALAWALRRDGWGDVRQRLADVKGRCQTRFERHLQPRPPLAPLRKASLTALLLGCVAGAWMWWNTSPIVARGLTLLGALVLAGVLPAVLGARRRLRPRSLFKLWALTLLLVLLVELTNILVFILPKLSEATLFTPDPITGFSNTPGYRQAGVSIDELGFRDPRVDVHTLTSEQFVVLILGGSTVFGWNLQDEESLGRLLETELEKRGRKDVVVLNPSTPGWYSWNELRYYEHRAPRYPIDAVVILHGRNDLYYGWQADPGAEPPAHAPWAFQARQDVHETRLAALARWSLLARGLGFGIQLIPAGQVETTRAARLTSRVFTANVVALAELAGERHLPTFEFLQPLSYAHRDLLPAEEELLKVDTGWARGYWEGLPELLEAEANLPTHEYFHHWSLVDALSRGACPEQAYIDECHYSVAATRVLAGRIAQALVDELPR